MVEDLVLDPNLKFWVLIPISLVMVIVGLLRLSITSLLKKDPKLEDFKKNREKYVTDCIQLNLLTLDNSSKELPDIKVVNRF